ncbi:hypothetical protein AC578_10714 [Pseudocercospora eumusae]|uniref:N-acetyltransferase domain-containing protein n=1 Tax=Pseudocercospora eumusae TaxID=321146 RepID=A0A139H4F4_9PEZI|nr:hypothetical protein AC578_10714 [Pseudocercospora eumusae]
MTIIGRPKKRRIKYQSVIHEAMCSSRNSKSTFKTRHATEQDVDFILAAFDSTLPYLESIGAGGMWDSKSPFSTRDGFRKNLVESVQERSSVVMVLIAERGDCNVGVARVVLSLPRYLYEDEELRGKLEDEDALEEVLYLEVLVSDFRVEERVRRGCGEITGARCGW